MWLEHIKQEPCPLNTLANAVLAKSDQMRQMAERNYGEQEVKWETRRWKMLSSEKVSNVQDNK